MCCHLNFWRERKKKVRKREEKMVIDVIISQDADALLTMMTDDVCLFVC